MLNLYLVNPPDNTQFYNDAFFDLSIENLTLSDEGATIIKQIDGVRYAGNNRFYSKFEKGVRVSITELSTGCKTALNIEHFPNKIFYIGDCGENAKRVIFSFLEGNAFIDNYFIPEQFNNSIKVIYNSKNIVVHNNIELYKVLNKIYMVE